MTQLISERAENRYRNKNFLYVNCRWLIPSWSNPEISGWLGSHPHRRFMLKFHRVHSPAFVRALVEPRLRLHRT